MIVGPRTFVSPRDLAAALGISESSLKRWADDGAIRASRTAGGHRRIAVADAVRFIRDAKLPLARPELLGFDEIAAIRARPGECSADALYDALELDERAVARGLIVSSFVSGESLAGICDGPVREALRRAGELWLERRDGIVIEHRAVETCMQALGVIRASLPSPPVDAPTALGGAISGDPYLLPSLMAATVLADAGYREVNLGPEVPTDVLLCGIDRYRPELVWRTASTRTSAELLQSDLAALRTGLGSARASVVFGGRGIPASRLALPEGTHHLASMGELAGFARGLLAARGGGGSAEA